MRVTAVQRASAQLPPQPQPARQAGVKFKVSMMLLSHGGRMSWIDPWKTQWLSVGDSLAESPEERNASCPVLARRPTRSSHGNSTPWSTAVEARRAQPQAKPATQIGRGFSWSRRRRAAKSSWHLQSLQPAHRSH